MLFYSGGVAFECNKDLAEITALHGMDKDCRCVVLYLQRFPAVANMLFIRYAEYAAEALRRCRNGVKTFWVQQTGCWSHTVIPVRCPAYSVQRPKCPYRRVMLVSLNCGDMRLVLAGRGWYNTKHRAHD